MRLSHFAFAVVSAFALLTVPARPPRCAASPDEQAGIDPARLEAETINDAASVHGKYRTLLRRIHCPEDRTSYRDFTDYGMYTGTSWHNHTNLPPGYWVYVYPDWYIWRDCTEDGTGALRKAMRKPKAKE
jgi:hypothetical protein